MIRQNQNLLLIFAKFPEPRFVKTRLGRTIGFELAAQIYQAFLSDLALRFQEQNDKLNYDVRWVFVPRSSSFPELITSILGQDAVLARTTFVAYETSGLLQQQIDQFKWAQQNGYDKVVGISTDTPHLPYEYVLDAFQRLSKFDIVIGPTLDGGFYLLAMNPKHLLQQNIEMSTNHVTKDLLAAARIRGLQTYLLPALLDVDDENDLQALAQFLSSVKQNICPNTQQVLLKQYYSTDRPQTANED